MDTPRQPAVDATAVSPVGAVWHKSSYSGTNGNCVEVARSQPGLVVVRDSKVPEGPALNFAADAWRDFLRGLRAGQFGL